MSYQSSVDKSKARTMNSLQYDMSTIEAATDNFSDANMIGVGGFGSVYKVQVGSTIVDLSKSINHTAIWTIEECLWYSIRVHLQMDNKLQ